MEIIVKKDILDELLAKGICQNKEEADNFLKNIVEQIATNMNSGCKVKFDGFGAFLTANIKNDKDAKIVEQSSIAEKITTSSMDKERASNGIQMLFHFIKEMIIKGNEVQIIHFASFRMETKKSHVVKSPRSGQKVVVPEKRILVFEAEKVFCGKVNNNEVQFEPDGEFKSQIELLKSSSILLIVPNRDFFTKTVEYHFEKAGWRVNTAQTKEEAERFLGNGKHHLVVLDSEIPDHQTYCEMIKFRRENSSIPLIIIYPKNVDLKKTDYFRICGDESIIQPFELKQLLKVSQSAIRRASEEGTIVKQAVSMRFPTVDKYIDKANELCGKLFAMSGLDEESQVMLCAAFKEALANSAQHGNKHRRDKLLEVHYRLDKEKMVIAVTDNGFGFDWQKFLNVNKAGDAVGRARQSHREGRMGGLGIMLMLRCVDQLEYNDTGNSVTLIKYLNKKS